MMVRFFDFSVYHNKNPRSGSTKIRVDNLIKYWPEAGLYKYGENPDVLIFQKVYCTVDYKFPKVFENTKILDVCDPDWINTPEIYIKETIDAVDAVVVSTLALQKLFGTMTDTPVKVIKDRFDLEEFPKPKVHSGKTKRGVWFGYSHNSSLLRYAVPSLEKRGIDLTVVSNEDPSAYRWADKPDDYAKKYTYVKYDQENIYEILQSADICIMPKGFRPEDRYKSENKTIVAQLCGLPAVSNAEEIDAMEEAVERNKCIEAIYDTIRKEYDVHKSVSEYKELIQEIGKNRNYGS